MNPLVTLIRLAAVYVATFHSKDGDAYIDKHVFVLGNLWIVVRETTWMTSEPYEIDEFLFNDDLLPAGHDPVWKDWMLAGEHAFAPTGDLERSLRVVRENVDRVIGHQWRDLHREFPLHADALGGDLLAQNLSVAASR